MAAQSQTQLLLTQLAFIYTYNPKSLYYLSYTPFVSIKRFSLIPTGLLNILDFSSLVVILSFTNIQPCYLIRIYVISVFIFVTIYVIYSTQISQIYLFSQWFLQLYYSNFLNKRMSNYVFIYLNKLFSQVKKILEGIIQTQRG